MANILNDNDEVLQASTTRLNVVDNNYISFISSDPYFTVNNGTATPSTITITFVMNGALYGTPTITYSGISTGTVTVVSSTQIQVVIAASNMTADTCSVTCSLSFLGNTYTSTAKVSGSVSPPSQVGTATTTTEGLLVRLSWPRITDIDVSGYEVRDTDADWGTTSGYLYRGATTSCTVSPGSLGEAKTWYIKAYDTSNLYSTNSRSVSFTVAAPVAPSGLDYSWPTTSLTNSTVTVTWDTSTPVFSLKSYRLRLAYPDGTTTKDFTTSTPNIIINADWVGTASFQLFVTDVLGNESSGSTILTIGKAVPDDVSTPITIGVVGSKLLLSWTEVEKTDLPISGYEVRSANSNWGSTTTLPLWKGQVSQCQVDPGALGTEVSYYVKAIDTDGQYSNGATATPYTRSGPPQVVSSSITFQFSPTTSNNSSVTISWSKPTGETFAINFYRVVLTKPDNSTVTADVYDNIWTIDANWAGSATFSIKTVDVFGVESQATTKSIISIAPKVRGYSFNSTSANGSVYLTWTPGYDISGLAWTRSGTVATITFNNHGYSNGTVIDITASSSLAAIPIGEYTVQTSSTNTFTITCLNAGAASGTITDSTVPSLSVATYEIRSADNSTVLYKGNNTNFTVPTNKLVADTDNIYYLYAIDSSGRYSTDIKSTTYTIQPPGTVDSINKTINSTSATVSTMYISWNAPAITSLAVSKYKVYLVRPNAISTTLYTSSTGINIDFDWGSTSAATIYITTIDILNQESAVASALLTLRAPGTPPTATVTPTSTGVSIAITPPTKTDLPIAGYEIRSADSNWGEANALWRGTSTTATLTNSELSLNNTWYLKAYDTGGVYSDSAKTITFNVTAPSSLTISTPTYSTNVSGSTITFKWSVTVGTFAIDRYDLILSKAGGGSLTSTLYTDTFTTNCDWNTGNSTLTIKAYDTAGNSATQNLVFSKSAPVAPVADTTTASISGVTFKWLPSQVGSLPIAGYEIRTVNSNWGNTTTSPPLWKGTVLSYEYKTISSTPGDNILYLRAFDTNGEYSTTTTLTYTSVRPGTPTGVSGSFGTQLTSATATFRWTAPTTSVFGIDRYVATFTPPTGYGSVKTYTGSFTEWTIAADWVGAGTFTVTAYDYMNIASLATTAITLTKELPTTPSAANSSIVGTEVNFDWPDNSVSVTQVPVVGYEVRTTTTGWGTGNQTWKGSVSSVKLDLAGTSAGTTKIWYLNAYDIDSRYATTARTLSYQVLAPVDTTNLKGYLDSTNLTSSEIVLSWDPAVPVFGLKTYRLTGTLTRSATAASGSGTLTLTGGGGDAPTKGIKKGDIITGTGIPAGTTVSAVTNTTQISLSNNTTAALSGTTVSISSTIDVDGTTSSRPADWLGSKTWTVRVVDRLGNASSGISIAQTKDLPSSPGNYRAQIVDNNVLLYWTPPTPTSSQLPVYSTRIKKGSSWNDGTIVGDKSGSFTTILELQGGSYTYWLATIDTDGNESSAVSLAATVSQPPDYIFTIEWSAGQGTKTTSNAITDPNTGYIVLPVDTTESYQTHFTSRSWTSPQSQITAGYPVYIQPGTTSGYYQEVFNYGTVVPSTQISVAVSGNTISGTVSPVVDIYTSLNNTDWTPYLNSTSAYAGNFQYVKIVVTVTQSVVGSIYQITSLKVRLDAKQKTDAGSVVISQQGAAQPQGSIAPDYVSIWTPVAAGAGFPASITNYYSLNGTASENAIITTATEGGATEPMWVCYDADATSDNDGGFNSSYITASTTSTITNGHLFAVWMKTTTNNGTSYLGCNNNSTIQTLAGTTAANPYFWSGDLPALNTWYLVVGYLHESGYGTTDTGISGVYATSGTTRVAGAANIGAEFKVGSGTTLRIRGYHFSNTTNSGQIVQYMARPVIIPCSTLAAPSVIQYLQQCFTKYGAVVTPQTSFVDVVSLTTTSQTPDQQTTVVDFADVPYPKRFNVFNYNSTGVLTGGTVSWTIRGY